ncbi:MAG TPA: hypothetical protein VMZ69_11230 [Saprospiraceae bacterium]|nr:hypothetical protein [Saprospiraceae bacterium]
MTVQALKKAAMLTVVLVITFILCWEIFWRQRGVDTGFDDGGPLWSHQRTRVYKPSDQSTVFIGASRIKFDLDIPTWTALTGESAVQLACVGSSPLPVLYNLADDPDFKGKVVVDVTEDIFFALYPWVNESPDKYLKYYQDITPAQRASFVINKPLEHTFAFLDKSYHSINALLDRLEIKSRPGVFMQPLFPPDFERVKFDRQCYMQPSFVADPKKQKLMADAWRFFATFETAPTIEGAVLDSLLETVKVAADKIKARGGKIIYVRTPSSGAYWAADLEKYPREKYWDKLIAYTNDPGIHFLDYPATDHYVCPEDSHLRPHDAIDYTHHFVDQLEEKGWVFSKRKRN